MDWREWMFVNGIPEWNLAGCWRCAESTADEAITHLSSSAQPHSGASTPAQQRQPDHEKKVADGVQATGLAVDPQKMMRRHPSQSRCLGEPMLFLADMSFLWWDQECAGPAWPRNSGLSEGKQHCSRSNYSTAVPFPHSRSTVRSSWMPPSGAYFLAFRVA